MGCAEGSFIYMMGRAGFEPATNWLKANCYMTFSNLKSIGYEYTCLISMRLFAV